MRPRRSSAIVLLVLLLGAAACSRGPGGGPDPGGPTAGPQAGADRSGAVYSAVLRHHLTTRDHSFGDGHRFATVYVLDHSVAGAGDPMRTVGAGQRQAIPDESQQAVVRALADVGAVEFVADRDDVVERPDGCERVRGEGVLVTLGPVPERGDRVEIGVNGFVACLAATWLTYVVERDGSGWVVKGTTGPVAIS